MKKRPFRILILGDFSGRKNKGVSAGELGFREPETIPFDRYDFSNLFKLLSPELRLPSLNGGDSPISLRFEEMGDFHPDKLTERIPFLSRLAEISQQLEVGVAFDRAFNELQSVMADFNESGDVRSDFACSREKIKDETAFSLKEEGCAALRRLDGDGFANFIGQTLSPYLTKEITPQQEEIISVFKEFARVCLRGVIHHPDFQSLESSWRSLRLLAARLEPSPDLRMCLVDISKEEISNDFSASERIEESLIYKLLVESALINPEAEPWTLLAADYFFGNGPDDVRCLGAMGRIAELARTPFIAGADSDIVASWLNSQEDDSKAEEWRNLRLSSEAAYISLIVPRFLLRLPYGRETSSCEGMDFEELSTLDSHHEYLWGNSAFLGAYLLGDSFLRFGWNLDAGLSRNVEGLPLHVYRREGKTKLKPCAEVILGLRELQTIAQFGLVPLYSIPESDEVRLGDLLSLAFPVSRLQGSWS